MVIGRSIMKNLKVFPFDELLSSLDTKILVQMRIKLESLHKELGTTMIYVTHKQIKAMTMADKIVALDGGKVRQAGKPMDLYRRTVSEFVAGFIGSPAMDVIDVNTSVGQSAGPRPAAARIGIRLEHVEITRTGTSAAICVKEPPSGESCLYVRTGDGVDLVVNAQGGSKHDSGDSLSLSFPCHRVHQFAADGAALTSA